MATPRRRWFPLYTTLYREPWPREWKLTIAMLGMLMIDRWASDRLTDEQATRTRLSVGDQLEVTGCESTEEALAMLRAIAKARAVRLIVRPLGNGFIELQWPKLLETLRTRRPLTAPLASAYGPLSAPSSSSSSSSEEDHEKESADALDLDPRKLVSLLGKEPGTAAAKLAWLEAELPVIELLAAEDHPDDPKRRMAAVRSRVLRHYRQHRKHPQRLNGNAPPAPGSKAARRELIQQLYAVKQLIPEPSEDAITRWEAAGKPQERAWWLPPEDRTRLRVVS